MLQLGGVTAKVIKPQPKVLDNAISFKGKTLNKSINFVAAFFHSLVLGFATLCEST